MAREADPIAEQRRALGQRLAAFRQAVAVTQQQLGHAASIDRSLVAHIEAGRSRADERFWTIADELCQAQGHLLAAFHEFETVKADHERQDRDRRLAASRASLARWQDRNATPVILEVRAESGLQDLRAFVLGNRRESPDGEPIGHAQALTHTATVHRLYQSADYDAAAQALPSLLAQLEQLTDHDSRPVAATSAAAYIAGAKLATKQADAALAWVTADRALRHATATANPALTGAAHYQVACAQLRDNRTADAIETAETAADKLAATRSTADRREMLSVSGALLLLLAVLAARIGDATAAHRHLHAARARALELNTDGNWLWTAFGPTNVTIHELAVHVELGQPEQALRLGEVIDTDQLPTVLAGRRSQVHLDLARAAAHHHDDALALLHLLEGERVAPQAVSRNAAARSLLTTLLARERRHTTPGLRALATRAGVA